MNVQPNPTSERFFKSNVLIWILVFIGIFGLYFSTIIKNPFTVSYPLALVVGPLLFLLVRYRLREHYSVRHIDNSMIKIGTITYSFLFVILLYTYYAAGFRRNTAVFLMIFGLYSLTVVLVWARSTPVYGLTLISVTGITSRMMGYYGSELYVGVDIYGHNRIVESIVQVNSMEPLLSSKYYYAPIYHLLTASGDLILGVPVKTASALTTLVVVTVVPAIVVFVLIRYLWNVQTALMGAFLYTASDHAIRWAVHTIPTSLGLVFFGLLVFALFRYDREYRRIFLLLFVLSLVFLTFTHQVSSFIAVVFVGSYLATRILYEGTVREHVVNVSLLSGLVLVSDFVVTKFDGPGGVSFFELVLGNFVSKLLTAGVETRPEVTLPQDPSISGGASAGLNLIQVGGSALLLCLALVGSLYWLNKKRESSELFTGLAFGVTVTVMLAFILGGPIVGIRNLLPMRWFAFVYIPLTVLAAPAMAVLIKTVSGLGGISGRNTVLALILLSFPFIVLMGGNYAGAADNPYFDQAPAAEVHGISETEEAMFEHTVQYSSEMLVGADRRATSILRDNYGIRTFVLSTEYNEPGTLPKRSLIFNRSYTQSHHSQYILKFRGQNHVVHGPFPFQNFNITNRNSVYDTGSDELDYISG